ncbi:MAG: CoA transferase, partial [Deltaproteobacteria bacterium]|nr:CoA transferase [Deltaproteobacteria bacterium]
MPEGMRYPDVLEGVRLLELGDGTAGLGGKLLADLGARVTKVDEVADVRPEGGLGALARLYHDRRKRCLRLDLESEAGREALRGLIAETA